MSNSTQKAAKPTAKTKDTGKVDTKGIDKKNREDLKKEITNKKDLLYKYTKDENTLGKRKVFRRKARSKVKSFAKKIKKAEKKDAEKLQKKLNAYAKRTFTPEGIKKWVEPVLS